MDKPLVNYIWSKNGTQTLDIHATDVYSDFLHTIFKKYRVVLTLYA